MSLVNAQETYLRSHLIDQIRQKGRLDRTIQAYEMQDRKLMDRLIQQTSVIAEIKGSVQHSVDQDQVLEDSSKWNVPLDGRPVGGADWKQDWDPNLLWPEF